MNLCLQILTYKHIPEKLNARIENSVKLTASTIQIICLFEKVTCVRPAFSSWDDETKGTIWGPDELQEKGSVRENLRDSAHWTHQSGGEHIFNAQGPVKIQLGAVGAAAAENHPWNQPQVRLSYSFALFFHWHLPGCQTIRYLHLSQYSGALCPSL